MFDFFPSVSGCEKFKVGNFNNHNSYTVISPIFIIASLCGTTNIVTNSQHGHTCPIDPDVFWKEIRKIGREAQMVTCEVSEKFVSLPKRKNLLGDLLDGFKRFRNFVRWKKFFLSQGNQKKENEEKMSERKNDSLLDARLKEEEKDFWDLSENFETNDFQTSADRIK